MSFLLSKEQVMEQLSFDSLEPIEVPLKIGKDSYVIVEASEAVAARFDDAKMANAVVDDATGKVSGLVSNAARAVLIQGCLFKQATPSARESVSMEFAAGLKHSISSKVYDVAYRISGFPQVEAVSKKLRPATDGTSD